MCVILFKPATVAKDTVKSAHLYNSWCANSDGAGIMWAHNHRLHLVKGLMTYQAFKAQWDRIPQRAAIVAHFRIATHGARDATMTHPFWINEDEFAVAHNGILPIEADRDHGLSDTAVFVERVLKALPAGWAQNPAILHLIDGYIGYGNKLVFLHKSGQALILNRKAGVEDGEMWWSNKTFQYARNEIGGFQLVLRSRARKAKRDTNVETAQNMVDRAGSVEAAATELGVSQEELFGMGLHDPGTSTTETDDEAIRRIAHTVHLDQQQSQEGA